MVVVVVVTVIISIIVMVAVELEQLIAWKPPNPSDSLAKAWKPGPGLLGGLKG